jgi:hypothetical protein
LGRAELWLFMGVKKVPYAVLKKAEIGRTSNLHEKNCMHAALVSL